MQRECQAPALRFGFWLILRRQENRRVAAIRIGDDPDIFWLFVVRYELSNRKPSLRERARSAANKATIRQ
jgi:hypothetical protein